MLSLMITLAVILQIQFLTKSWLKSSNLSISSDVLIDDIDPPTDNTM